MRRLGEFNLPLPIRPAQRHDRVVRQRGDPEGVAFVQLNPRARGGFARKWAICAASSSNSLSCTQTGRPGYVKRRRERYAGAGDWLVFGGLRQILLRCCNRCPSLRGRDGSRPTAG
jgi:hypothetical protein